MNKNNYYSKTTDKVEELKHFPFKSFSNFQAAILNGDVIDISIPMDHARNWITKSADSPRSSRNFSLLLISYVFLLPIFYVFYGIFTLNPAAIFYVIISAFVAFTGSPMARRFMKSHYYVIGVYILIWLIGGSFPRLIFLVPVIGQYLAFNQLYQGSAAIVREKLTKSEKVLCLFWKWYYIGIILKDGNEYTQNSIVDKDRKYSFYEDVDQEWKEYIKEKDKTKPNDVAKSEIVDNKKTEEAKDKTTNNIWEEYSNLDNSNENLVRKSELLTPFIVYLGTNYDESLIKIFKSSKKPNKKIIDNIEKKKGDLRLKYTFLMLHLADRLAFQYLNEEQRTIFVDNLVENVFTDIVNNSISDKSNKAVLKLSLGSIWNEFQNNYGKYKQIIADKDESFKDTLLWEFSKDISSLILNKPDLAISMGTTSMITNDLISLQIQNLLKT